MIKNDDCQFFKFSRFLILKSSSSEKGLRFKANFFYSHQETSLNLEPTFRVLEAKHPKIRSLLVGTQLFYFDQQSQTNLFVGNYPFVGEVFVPFNKWVELDITFNFRKQEGGRELGPVKLEDRSPKRAGERTIQEAMDCVDRWYKQMESKEELGKSVSMSAAAKAIGISQKTLADYSRCLRLGEQFGFDLHRRTRQRISVLRNYVKEQRVCEESEEKKIDNPDIYWQSSFFNNYD